MTLSDETAIATRAECLKRSEVEEQILQLAYAGGCESITIKWPNTYGEGYRFELEPLRGIVACCTLMGSCYACSPAVNPTLQ
jgi:hypothetical protein